MALAQAGEWPATISPRVAPLADPLTYRWTWALDGNDARLAPIGDRLWLARADGRLFSLRAEGPPDGEPDAVLPRGGFRPAYGGDPVYVTDSGEVGRWSPALGWRGMWSAGLAGRALDAFGMAGGKVLLSSAAWADGLRLLDEHSASVVWSLGAVAPGLLAVEEIGLVWGAGRAHAVDLASGRVLWGRKSVRGVAALSGSAAWLVDESGDLIEVSGTSGEVTRRARLPGGVASFALAPSGLLYALGRPLEALVLDLLDGLCTVAQRSYLGVFVQGAPRVVALASDARLVVVTADAALELLAERHDAMRELWRTDGLIVDAQAGGAELAVVTIDDAHQQYLTLLGAA